MHDLLFYFVVANPPRPFVDAFQIVGLLAIHLHNRHNNFERFVFCFCMAKHYGTLDIQPCSAGVMNFITRINTHHPYILTGGFRAIARTAGHSHFYFSRCP